MASAVAVAMCIYTAHNTAVLVAHLALRSARVVSRTAGEATCAMRGCCGQQYNAQQKPKYTDGLRRWHDLKRFDFQWIQELVGL